MTSEVINRVIQGRYRLISQLAVGGMGVTYRAWNIRVGAPVVLKLPRKPSNDPDGSEFARLAARFAREVDVMRALGHDHIVPIVDQGDDDGLPFVAMRFLPGGALSDHRKKSSTGDWQPVPASQLHFWLPSIADALDFMHSRGVLHRDVKPANIFVDGFHNAFLGDFGIAKVVGDEPGLEKGQTLTATHLAIGTPEYMAPELLSPKAVADGRADQYALAICVYELLSGRRPFTGSTAHVVIEHATHPVPPLDRELLGLPASLTEAIERALAKKPDQRFESCKAFSRAALADVSMPPNEPGVARLLCPECRKVLRVPLSAGGQNGNCPSCKQSMEIAQDFSALWLTSEATIVAEPAMPLWAAPSLGTVDTETTAADAVLPVSAFVPVDRPKGLAATLAGIVATAVIAALLSGLFMHVRWEEHHSRAVQEARAALEQQQAAHAVALQDAERRQIEAVESVEATWEKTLAESQEAWAEDLAAAKAKPEEVEKNELGVSDKKENDDFPDLIRESNEAAEPTGKAAAPSSPVKKDGALKSNEDSEVKESSVRFSPEAVRLKAIEKSFWLVFGHKDNPVKLVNFEGDREEAVKVLALLRHFGVNNRVALTDTKTGESFDYWLSDGWAPTGAFPSLLARDMKFIVFNPDDLAVSRIGELEGFFVRDGKTPTSIGHFTSKALAEKMLEAVQTYGFNCKCIVGARNAHFRLFMRK